MKKIVLAYSGGLDTTCAIKYLSDKGFSVICFSANLGSEFSPADLKKRAIKTGAAKIYIKDLRKEFAYDYVLPALKADAIYERKYVLSTALGRPLIAKYLVDVALMEGAKYVAHGCTGKGNDQVRIDMTVNLLAPQLKIIAPLREWDMESREEEIVYAKKHHLPLKITKEKIYSIDKNIWGTSVEGGSLEDLTKEPPQNSYYSVKPLDRVENKPYYLEIEFAKGLPFKLNNQRMTLVALIEKLNKIGAQYGVGRTDSIENRVVGIKSREIYEAPGAWILHTAHRELESLALDRETLIFKELIAAKYAQLAYQGFWFTDLRRALDGFVEKTQTRVQGVIGLKLFKGNIIVTSRVSSQSLYKKEMATYSEGSTFDKSIAEGFIKLLGMPFNR